MNKVMEVRKLGEILRSNPWPLPVHADLIKAVGLHGAVVLRYIDNWLQFKEKKSDHHTFKQGRWWLYYTLDELVENVPITSKASLRRVLEELREGGYLIAKDLNKQSTDRTLWYTVDYDKQVRVFVPQKEGANAQGEQMQMLRVSSSDMLRESNSIPCRYKQQVSTERIDPSDRPGDGPEARPLPGTSSPPTSKEMMQVEKDQGRKENPVSAAKAKIVAFSLSKGRERVQKAATVANAIAFWKSLLAAYEVTSHISLTKKETGMMKSLVKWLTDTDIPVHEFLEWVVVNWKANRAKLTWPGQPGRFRLAEQPFFQEVMFNKEDLVRLWERRGQQDSQGRKDERVVYTSIDQIPPDHPQYAKLKVQIETLGKAVTTRRG